MVTDRKTVALSRCWPYIGPDCGIGVQTTMLTTIYKNPRISSSTRVLCRILSLEQRPTTSLTLATECLSKELRLHWPFLGYIPACMTIWTPSTKLRWIRFLVSLRFFVTKQQRVFSKHFYTKDGMIVLRDWSNHFRHSTNDTWHSRIIHIICFSLLKITKCVYALHWPAC